MREHELNNLVDGKVRGIAFGKGMEEGVGICLEKIQARNATEAEERESSYSFSKRRGDGKSLR